MDSPLRHRGTEITEQNTKPRKALFMSKLRADSTWNGLTSEQREKLDEWLFEEGLSYPVARERVQKELGIECSISGVGRYYRRAVETRAVEKLAEAQDAAAVFEVGSGTDDFTTSM